jgi:SynChlorMet cassette protein ScmC
MEGRPLNYSIRLADGRAWTLKASDQTREWVGEFAAVLGCESAGNGEGSHLRIEYIDFVPDENMHPCLRLREELTADLPPEGWWVRGLRGLMLYSHPSSEVVICGLARRTGRDAKVAQMQNALYPVYESAVNAGGLPIHAALVEFEGRGILLAGRGGAGKSTCCRRLPSPWKVHSDDMALIVLHAPGEYRVHPLPTWSIVNPGGKDRCWHLRHHVPLAALCFLEQAEDDEIIPMGGGKGTALINESATGVFSRANAFRMDTADSEFRKKRFRNSADIAEATPLFKLRVSLAGRFWELLENVL